MAKEYIERNRLLEWAREFYPVEKSLCKCSN